jgi:RecA/RadA recombinase
VKKIHNFNRLLEVFFNREQYPPISFGCKLLDTVFGGGVKRGNITEIYGEAGTGKT